eukprot:UN29854
MFRFQFFYLFFKTFGYFFNLFFLFFILRFHFLEFFFHSFNISQCTSYFETLFLVTRNNIELFSSWSIVSPLSLIGYLCFNERLQPLITRSKLVNFKL